MIDLAKLVDDARLADLPEVAAALELARVRLALRLATPAPSQQPPAVGKWLTPEEAATIARASKRQVYEWALGKRWAHRPSRRKLLIDEAGFLAWLSSRPWDVHEEPDMACVRERRGAYVSTTGSTGADS